MPRRRATSCCSPWSIRRTGTGCPSLADVRQGHVPGEVIVRVIRPNGTQRTLSLTMEARFSAEGRPVAVNGTALDVSDREHLVHARHDERRRRAALYQTQHIASFWVGARPHPRDCRSRWRRSTACRSRRSASNPFLMIVPGGAHGLPGDGRGAHRAADASTRRPPMNASPTGSSWHFRIFTIPIWDPDGTHISADVVSSIRSVRTGVAACRPPCMAGFEQSVAGHHLRAARAHAGLVDDGSWPRRATCRIRRSGAWRKTASTVAAVRVSKRSRRLRHAGDAFRGIMDDGTLAVAKA